MLQRQLDELKETLKHDNDQDTKDSSHPENETLRNDYETLKQVSKKKTIVVKLWTHTTMIDVMLGSYYFLGS